MTGNSSDIGNVNFVRLRIEDQVKVKERKRPDEPPPPKKPPPPKRMEMEQVEQPDTPTPQITIPNLNLPTVSGAGASIGGFGLAQGAGEDRNSKSMLRSRIDPIYPQQAALEGLEGSVRMRVTIGKDGAPTKVDVIDYTDRIFVNPARRAIFRWRWEPAYENGEPIEWTYTAVMPFKLTN